MFGPAAMRPQPGGGAGEKARPARADQPSYRSGRDPAAPDTQRTSRRGNGAPRRRCATQTARRGTPRKRGPHGRPRLSRRRETPARRGSPAQRRKNRRERRNAEAGGGEAAARSPAARKPGEGAEKPSYRSGRDPAAPDTQRTSRRGNGAPRRRCAAQTTRRGTPRKRGPRRLPGRTAGRESLRHDRYRPRRRGDDRRSGAETGRSDRDGGGATDGEE